MFDFYLMRAEGFIPSVCGFSFLCILKVSNRRIARAFTVGRSRGLLLSRFREWVYVILFAVDNLSPKCS